MNRVVLLGRLTKDPEVKYLQNGSVLTRFCLAIDRGTKKEDGTRETDFINCQLWSKQAETFGNTVSKGQRVLVEGRLQIRQYKDKDGINRTMTEVVCNWFEYIERRKDDNTAPAEVQQAPQDGFDKMGDTLPFDTEVPF